MALEKQLVPVVFDKGESSITDPKLLQNPTLVTLENATKNKFGRISKRNGNVAYNTPPASVQFSKIFPYKNSSFAISERQSDGHHHVYSSAGGNWVDAGLMQAIPNIVANNELSAFDLNFSNCISNGTVTVYVCYGTFQATSGIYLFVKSATGEFIVTPRLIGSPSDGSRTRMMCKSGDDYVYITWTNAGFLNCTAYQISTNTFVTYNISALWLTPGGTTPQWDCVLWDNGSTREIIFAITKDDTHISFGRFTAPVMALVTTVDVAHANNIFHGFNIVVPVSNSAIIRLVAGGVTVSATLFYFTWNRIATTTSNTYSSGNFYDVVQKVVGIEYPGQTTFALFVGSTTGSPFWPNPVKTQSMVMSNAFTPSLSTTQQDVFPLTKPVLFSGVPYWVGTFISNRSQLSINVLSTLVLMSNDSTFKPMVCGRMAFDENQDGLIDSFIEPSLSAQNSTDFITCDTTSKRLTQLQPYCVSSYVLKMNPADGWRYTATNDGTMITGGFLSRYDSLSVVEHNFLVYPSIYNLTQTPSGGAGFLNTKTYGFIVVSEWSDEFGNVEFSAPSKPSSILMSATGTVTVNIYTNPLTMKDSSTNATKRRNGIIFRVFCTQADDSVYYLLGSVGNTTTAANVSITFTTPPVGNTDILYTQGGIIPNWCYDAQSAITSSNDLIATNDANDNRVINFSKRFILNEIPELTTSFRIFDFNSTGPVTALQFMDDKLIVFRAQAISFCQGNGFDDTGTTGGFSPFQVITNDIGTVNQDAIVFASEGIYFKSNKGIWILGRDLSLNYIGADEDQYNNLSVRSSVNLGDKNQVRFLLSDNSTIIEYNNYFKQWSHLTGYAASYACDVNGVFAFVRNSSTTTPAFVESSGYVDNNNSPTTIQTTITTAPINLNSIQGFQRLFNIMILGNTYSSHTLNVDIDYDYEGTFSEHHSITSADMTSNGTHYQARLNPSRQRCESMQLKIYDSSITGQDFDLNTIMLLIGSAPRAIPVSATKGF